MQIFRYFVLLTSIAIPTTAQINNASRGRDLGPSDAANLLVNGHFDSSLEPWINAGSRFLYSTEDAEDSSSSGSAAVANLEFNESASIVQCVETSAKVCQFSALLRVDGESGHLDVISLCESFVSTDCTGYSLAAVAQLHRVPNSGGAWISLLTAFTAPPATRSLVCGVIVFNTQEDRLDAYLDQLILSREDVFADGFESGDLSAWSSDAASSLSEPVEIGQDGDQWKRAR